MLRLTVLSLMLVLAGCASNANKPAASAPAAATSTEAAQSASAARTVKSTDGSFEGEIVGTIKPGSKFSQLKIGMTMSEVQQLIKAPDDLIRHETGKRWIPFYFGNDSQRLQAYYQGEGCLTYTGGNVFGGGGNQLIRITADATKTCME